MWWRIVLIAVALLSLWLFLIAPRLRRPDLSALRVDFAHRGLHGGDIPENSLPAFARAVQEGFGIELDVQLSADGVIMVFHDPTLMRMTGQQGKLSDYTAAQLCAMTLGDSAYTIPTLDEVLTLVDGRVPLLIELKGESTSGDAALCESLCARLDSYTGAYCVESFNPSTLRWFKRNRPDIVRGQLVSNAVRERDDLNIIVRFVLTHQLSNVLSRPDFIAYDRQYPNELSLWMNLHLFRAAPFVWTVRDAGAWTAAHKDGANAIFEGFVPDRAAD